MVASRRGEFLHGRPGDGHNSSMLLSTDVEQTVQCWEGGRVLSCFEYLYFTSVIWKRRATRKVLSSLYPPLHDLSAEERCLLFNFHPCRKRSNNESVFFLRKSVPVEGYQG